MFILIERYIDNLTIDNLNDLATGKGIYFNDEELNFSYNFIKKNWKMILSNHGYFPMDNYKKYYTEENFIKIKKLINEYIIKYAKYL